MDDGSKIGLMEGAFFVPKGEILNWVNTTLKLNLTKIEQLGTGAVYCQIIDILKPGQVNMSKVNFNAKVEWEFLNNYKVLSSTFEKCGIKRYIEVEKLARAQFQDNLEFAQWIKRFFDLNKNAQILESYNPVARRGHQTVDFSFAERPIKKNTLKKYCIADKIIPVPKKFLKNSPYVLCDKENVFDAEMGQLQLQENQGPESQHHKLKVLDKYKRSNIHQQQLTNIQQIGIGSSQQKERIVGQGPNARYQAMRNSSIDNEYELQSQQQQKISHLHKRAETKSPFQKCQRIDNRSVKQKQIEFNRKNKLIQKADSFSVQQPIKLNVQNVLKQNDFLLHKINQIQAILNDASNNGDNQKISNIQTLLQQSISQYQQLGESSQHQSQIQKSGKSKLNYLDHNQQDIISEINESLYKT